ncbi:MAG: DUF4383 domain-containing protein [Nitriliruptorales bacterium]
MPAKSFAYVFGAAYLVAGLLGFVVTGFDGLIEPQGDILVIFEVNPLHNGVHTLIGVALVSGAVAGETTARQVALLVGIVYAVLGVVGFFLVDLEELNVLALNAEDNWLHIGTAVLAIAFGFASRAMVPDD